jgi:hypothetical protein
LIELTGAVISVEKNSALTIMASLGREGLGTSNIQNAEQTVAQTMGTTYMQLVSYATCKRVRSLQERFDLGMATPEHRFLKRRRRRLEKQILGSGESLEWQLVQLL